MGKEFFFPKIGPIMMEKGIGYKISTIYLFYLHVKETIWPKLVQLISWDALQKSIFKVQMTKFYISVSSLQL